MEDNNVELSRLSVIELLRVHASALDELRKRSVVRTKNNPVGDYTEWLVSRALELELADNSAKGYDARDSNEVRYQIKGRRVTQGNPSRQLGAIRNLGGKQFDVLAVVIFDEKYNVLEAVTMPHEAVCQYASYRRHVNAHILHLRGAVLMDDRVQRISKLFAADGHADSDQY